MGRVRMQTGILMQIERSNKTVVFIQPICFEGCLISVARRENMLEDLDGKSSKSTSSKSTERKKRCAVTWRAGQQNKNQQLII